MQSGGIRVLIMATPSETPRMELLKNFMPDSALQYAQSKKLIPQEKLCSCGHAMSVQECSKMKMDKVCWKCSKCKQKTSIRSGTFFENSNLTLSVILQIMFDFVCQLPVTCSANLTGITHECAIQWYEYCRDVCTTKMVKERKMMGGPGHVIQVDENLHFKSKDHICSILGETWIIGFYDETKNVGFLQQIPDRSATTLEHVILEYVAPGSTVSTVQLKGYNNLEKLGYVHRIVSDFSVCTSTIGEYWSRIKRRLKHMAGSVSEEEMKWSHVDEAMYREAYHMTCEKVLNNFETFLQHVQEIYS